MLKKLIVSVFFALCFSQSVAALDEKEAEQFMKGIGDHVVQILTNPKLSPSQRAEKFRKILETKFNLKAIGKFVLGRHWKEASENQKKIFLELFTETSIATYASRFAEYTTEKFEVFGSRKEKDGGVLVLSRIVRPNNQKILINWKVFEKKGDLRIYDVILEGISMGITQRSEFSSVIQKGGGIQALLKGLSEKVHTSTHTE